MTINSSSFFGSHRLIWKLIGGGPIPKNWPHLYIVYSLLLNFLLACFPLHMAAMLFRNGNLKDDINNLTTFATTTVCTIKSAINVFNFYKVRKIEQLLGQLDARVKTAAELNIFNQIKTSLRTILYAFLAIFFPIGVFAELSVIYHEGRSLMYPGWFPFDWRNSTRNYYIVNIYQDACVFIQLLQNFVNDCLPAVVLCLISAHIQMLYMRIEQIGWADVEDKDAQHELENCITDHKILLELFDTIESLMSVSVLLQFAVQALNTCISIAALFFFVSEPLGRFYFLFYGLGITLQTLPTCFYGTHTEYWFGKLHYAAFSCNWMPQSRSFKKKLMILVERSLKTKSAMACGIVRINMTTFFNILQFAYSLFTILIGMRG